MKKLKRNIMKKTKRICAAGVAAAMALTVSACIVDPDGAATLSEWGGLYVSADSKYVLKIDPKLHWATFSERSDSREAAISAGIVIGKKSGEDHFQFEINVPEYGNFKTREFTIRECGNGEFEVILDSDKENPTSLTFVRRSAEK